MGDVLGLINGTSGAACQKSVDGLGSSLLPSGQTPTSNTVIKVPEHGCWASLCPACLAPQFSDGQAGAMLGYKLKLRKTRGQSRRGWLPEKEKASPGELVPGDCLGRMVYGPVGLRKVPHKELKRLFSG